MPSSDLVLNVKQISNYTPTGVQSSDQLLLQRGGIGGPYFNVTAAQLVSAALADGSASIQVGVAAPGDAIGYHAFLENVVTPIDGSYYWNAYVSDITGGLKPLIGSGPVGQFRLDLNAGWQFNWGPSGSITGTALTISGTGYLTVGDQVLLARDPTNQMEAATANFVNAKTMAAVQPLWSLYNTATVWSVNGRSGQIILGPNDIMGAGGAPIWSPAFQGVPTAPLPLPADNSSQIATTQWVWQAVSASLQDNSVTSFNSRTGAIVLTAADVSGTGGLVNPSPALTGIPTAPTAAPQSDNSQIATTAYVDNALATFNLSNYAPINSPNFTGSPTAPTVPPGANDGRLATTAFVHAAVVAATAGVSSFNTRTGAVVLTSGDITSAGGALLAGPVFTGVPAAPTAAPGTNTTQLATTAYVMAALAGGSIVSSFNTRTGAVTLAAADITGAGGALVNSPTFTGTPLAPTATAGNSSTQIATTAFVANAITGLGGVVSSFNGRSGAVTLQANDISAAGGAVLASPSFSGTPTAPTATAGTSTQQIATTAFVSAAIAAGGGVSSVNGRTGAITIIGTDITGAGGALLASPTFTGTPAGPTATAGTSTTQLATTAFVAAALTTGAVSSFNTRQGAVTLQTSDITGAGGAVLASPAFSGTPTAPTAATATNTTQIATTAFVANAINAIGAGVISFNGRTGAVSLIANDISSAGGAVLASPAFTGTPTAPTPASTDSSTTLATTAYVKTVIANPATVAPLMDGTAAVGTSLLYARQDHVHPSDTSRVSQAVGHSIQFAWNGTNLVAAVDGVSGTPGAIANYNNLNSYLLLSGGSLTGGLTGTQCDMKGTVNAWTVGGQAVFQLLNPSGSPNSQIIHTDATGILKLQNVAAGSNNIYIDATGNFNITGGTAYKPGGGSWTAPSDARIKTVEGDYALGLSEILKLKPVRYRYKGNDAPPDDATSRQKFSKGLALVGLVAQEVEGVFPGMVKKENGWIDGRRVDDMRTLDPSELVYALVNAVKALAARIEILEARTAT